MTAEELSKLKFSERQELSRGDKCKALWHVKSIGGSAYYIACRECGTSLQSGCVPKCLMNTEPNKKLD